MRTQIGQLIRQRVENGIPQDEPIPKATDPVVMATFMDGLAANSDNIMRKTSSMIEQFLKANLDLANETQQAMKDNDDLLKEQLKSVGTLALANRSEFKDFKDCMDKVAEEVEKVNEKMDLKHRRDPLPSVVSLPANGPAITVVDRKVPFATVQSKLPTVGQTWDSLSVPSLTKPRVSAFPPPKGYPYKRARMAVPSPMPDWNLADAMILAAKYKADSVLSMEQAKRDLETSTASTRAKRGSDLLGVFM